MKERWWDYTESMYQCDPNVTQVYNEQSYTMEPTVLQSEIKNTMRELSCNKAQERDEIPI